MLIEGATGIFTGSKYSERQIFEANRFLGEMEPITARGRQKVNPLISLATVPDCQM